MVRDKLDNEIKLPRQQSLINRESADLYYQNNNINNNNNNYNNYNTRPGYIQDYNDLPESLRRKYYQTQFLPTSINKAEESRSEDLGASVLYSFGSQDYSDEIVDDAPATATAASATTASDFKQPSSANILPSIEDKAFIEKLYNEVFDNGEEPFDEEDEGEEGYFINQLEQLDQINHLIDNSIRQQGNNFNYLQKIFLQIYFTSCNSDFCIQY